MCDLSITERLAREGISCERDSWTVQDYRHRLFANGAYIGRFDAHESVELLRVIARNHNPG